MFRQRVVEEELKSSDYYSLYKDLEEIINNGITLGNRFRSTLSDWEGSLHSYREIEKTGAYFNYGLSWMCQLAELVIRCIDEPEKTAMVDNLERASRVVRKQKDQLLDLKQKKAPSVEKWITEPDELSRLLYRIHLKFNAMAVRHKRILKNVPKSDVVWKYAEHNLSQAETFIGSIL